LKIVDVQLETIFLPHLDEEEMMAISLGLLVRGVLNEEGLDHLHKIMDKARR